MFYFWFVVILAWVCRTCAFLSKKLSRDLVHLLINGLEHLSVVRIKSISNDQVKVAAKNKNAKFFACELRVKRVGIFDVVLYRSQWPVNFIFHFAELHIGSYIRYENNLFKNIFFKCYCQKKFNILQLFF